MATYKVSYRANNQALTCTLASLANGNLRNSTAVDNTSNLDLDALVIVKVKSGASGVSATGYVNVYAYGSVDAGTTYSDGVTGTDAAFTATSPTNLILLGSINVVANATTYVGGPFSVAQAFGGVLPDHWGIVVENKSGTAFDSTEGNHLKIYEAIQATVA